MSHARSRETGGGPSFVGLLRTNRNYRYTWMGQVVSEIGDHFNNIAVFSLALETTGSGLVVMGVMLARAIPAVMAGPLAGVLLDRMDRKRIMIASDLVRAVVAALFILTVSRQDHWLLYLLRGLLMFASPFFTRGRASVLPAIASREDLHTANSLTQTTPWTTDAAGHWFEKVFTITVTNVNDAPTDLALSSTTIAEGASGRTVRLKPVLVLS